MSSMIKHVACLLPLLAALAMHGCDARATPPQPSQPSVAPAPDPGVADPLAAVDADYHALLSEVVDEEGLVRYRLLDEPERQQKLLSTIDGYAKAILPAEKHDRLALHCNAYNANALHMAWQASRQPGFESVKTVPGFFNEKTIVVAGQAMTLDALVAEIRAHDDPRVHAALACGARSCPPMRNEPYRGASLDRQLDDQSLRWVEDNTKNRVGQRSIALSQIFEWFADDFVVDPYGDAIGFIKKHGRPRGQIRDFMSAVSDFEIRYMPYDWRLNQSIFDEDPPSQP